ncbi:MAG: rhodanese-like domain-containing protein [Solirubrobacterales bacterium]
MKRKVILAFITLTLTAAIFAGCSSSNKQAASQTPAKTVGTSVDGNEVNIEKAAISLVKAKEAGKYNLVSTEELKSWVDSKKDMVIIDTMPAANFKNGHIPGAVNAELPKTGMKDMTAEQKAAFVKLLPADKSKTIVVYCGFTSCARSDVGAQIAVELGYTNVYRQPGGIVAWQDSKYDVEK